MSFYLFLLCGFLGGLLGGMGMGGGTLLIPLLTLLCGLEQGAAQGICLLSFLPASALALSVHIKQKRVKKEGLFVLILFALLFSGLSALVATALKGTVLRKGFGFFLLFLSVLPFRLAFQKKIGK